MSLNVRVEIENGDEVMAWLRSKPELVSAVLRSAVSAAGEAVRDVANGGAPGPHNQVEVVEVSRTAAVAHIGPDEAHWYYRFLEMGVGRHLILPDRAGAIYFPGADHPFFGADHPGSAARPFLRPAADDPGPASRAAGGVFKEAVS